MSRRHLDGISIRPLAEGDLAAADRIFRLAFGTFLGLPDPSTFGGDRDFVRTRWRAAPRSALGAYRGRSLVGSNFLARWGSFSFFGPLTVRPDLWDRGIGQRLLEATVARFRRWGTTHAGLYTFADSPKHVALYQRFGFWPTHLVLTLQREVESGGAGCPSLWSDQDRTGARKGLSLARELTHALHPGLDLGFEIRSIARQSLGDTVLVHDKTGRLGGFAVCHAGPGTEAADGELYVKFAAARSGRGASTRFNALLDACEAYAASRGVVCVRTGIHAARTAAYRELLARGYRLVPPQGVAMEWPGNAGFNRPDVFALDDWR